LGFDCYLIQPHQSRFNHCVGELNSCSNHVARDDIPQFVHRWDRDDRHEAFIEECLKDPTWGTMDAHEARYPDIGVDKRDRQAVSHVMATAQASRVVPGGLPRLPQ
jgi:hypothetical protein